MGPYRLSGLGNGAAPSAGAKLGRGGAPNEPAGSGPIWEDRRRAGAAAATRYAYAGSYAGAGGIGLTLGTVAEANGNRA